MVSLPLIHLWNKRSLLFHFAILNIRIRFKSTYLGFLWTALEPLLYFTILYVVFTSIRDQEEDFAIYLITGIMLFHIFVRGTSGGLSSLITHSGIIKSVSIRKEFFPVVATITVGILALVDVGVFFGIMPLFQFNPNWTIILLPLVLFLMGILILGLSYFLSILTVYVRDIQIMWAISVHALLFISPIIWYLDKVEGILLVIHKINPVGQLIEFAHFLVIYNQIPSLNEWLYTSSFVLTIFFLGYFIFQKMEGRITEKL